MNAAAEAPRGELMDRVYRHQRHIYDLTRKYYLLGRDHLIAALNPPTGGSVLEIGCGTARNLIAAAQAYPRASCYGVDISAEMLATARAEVEKAGLSARITLAKGDATRFDPVALFGKASFDCCFFSYSLSMIPGWREALDRAARLTSAERGRLHVVDFGQQEGLPDWFRTALFAWLQHFHVTPRVDLEGALEATAQAIGGTLSFRRLYRGYSWYAELSR
jgi:S-adenosylmethionine-diacylgycerolhomoserine-N-methlytransferase